MRGVLSRVAATAFLCLGALGWVQVASGYPTGPVTIVVPAPPGGTADRVARKLAERLTESLGQPVIMDYKPGAGNIVAEDFVVRSAPNGQTLLIDHSGLAMNPVLQKGTMRFDVQDLRPVIGLVRYQHILIVPASSPIRSVQDLVKYGKANPGKMNYGSAGAGTPQHLLPELLMRANGITATHVPYKGGSQMVQAVLSGDVDFVFVAVPSAEELVKSGKVRAIAVLDDARARAFPDVPTLAELGYRGMDSPWLGIFVPRATPEPVVQRLNQEFLKIMKEPRMVDWLAENALQPIAGTPAAFAQTIASEITFNEKLVKDLGLKVD